MPIPNEFGNSFNAIHLHLNFLAEAKDFVHNLFRCGYDLAG